MQVQLQDAFKAIADAAIERMKDELHKVNIESADVTATTPIGWRTPTKSRSTSRECRRTRAGDFRRLTVDSFTDWNLTAGQLDRLPADHQANGGAADPQRHHEQTMNTIEKKINGSGLAETSVQPTGRDENAADCWFSCRAWTTRRMSKKF